MTDMKYTKEELAKQNSCSPCSPSQQEYPYGLVIRLEESDLKKLGISGVPVFGTTMKLSATVEVINTNRSESDDGEYRGVSLQIQEMELSGKKTADEVAKLMYGG